jgi:hypothetical protein
MNTTSASLRRSPRKIQANIPPSGLPSHDPESNCDPLSDLCDNVEAISMSESTILPSGSTMSTDQFTVSIELELRKFDGKCRKIPRGYIREPTAPEKISQRAAHWNHGLQVMFLGSDKMEKEKGWKPHWSCKYCHNSDNVHHTSSQTSKNIRLHLKKTHNIELDKSPNREAPTAKPVNERREELKSALSRWICVDQVPFMQVESAHFRNLISVVNPEESIQLPTADTAKSWIVQRFREQRSDMALQLGNLTCKIHVEFDGWTAPNGLGLLGIIGHWVNKNTQFGRGLLGLKEIKGRHTGENIAAVVKKTFAEYNLPADRIGNYVLDNATNNNTAVRQLAHDGYGTFPSNEKRLRCLVHVLNLVTRSLLSTTNHNDDDLTPFDQDPSNWKRFPCIAKLQKLTNAIHHSTIARANYLILLNELLDDGQTFIKSDNATRFSSIWKMIDSVRGKNNVISVFLHNAINAERDKKAKDKWNKCLLTDEDWDTLNEIHRILTPLKLASDQAQSRPPSMM